LHNIFDESLAVLKPPLLLTSSLRHVTLLLL